MQGSIWEYPITALALLKEIRFDATLNNADYAEMISTKENEKNRQMSVEFLLAGSKNYDSIRINISNEFMMGKEEKDPGSITDTYNLMLHYKYDIGQTQ